MHSPTGPEDSFATGRCSQRLAALFQGTEDGIFVCAVPTRVILDVNTGASKLLRRSRDDLRRRRLDEVLHPDQLRPVEPLFSGLCKTAPNILPLDTELLDVDGRAVPVELTASFIEMDELTQGPAIVVMTRNISKRRQLEKQLAQSSKLASLGAMSAGLAHEINSPLGAILLLTGELKAQFNSVRPPDAAEFLQIIGELENSTVKISGIINGLRMLSRDSSNDSFVFASLRGILESALNLSRSRLANHGIKLDTDEIPAGMDMECHPSQISEVFLNLIQNAHDAIAEGSEKWIRIECEERANSVIVRIIDSGPGIPEAIRDKIFDPFFTTKDVGKGTGLGLSVVQRIIHNHRGSVHVDGTCRNTCFVVTLPKFQSF